jgi:glutamate racemase
MRIGIFDSGIGGLTVLSKLLSASTEYVYIGDNIHAPYGNKTSSEILSLTSRMLSFLASKDVGLYISACNSISAQDTRELLSKLCVDASLYIDMVSATRAHLRSESYTKSKVLIWATKATVLTNVYQDIFSDKGIEYIPLTSEHLAQAIETGDMDACMREINTCVAYIKKHYITHVFFGCTHFPHIERRLSDKLKEEGILNIEYIDPAHFVRKEVMKRLNYPEKVLGGRIEIYTTKNVPGYDKYIQSLEEGVHANIIEISI